MYGRNQFTNNSVNATRVSVDGSPKYKTGGITIDWTTVAAPGSLQTLPDNSTIQAGNKFLRYGQVLTKITASGKYGPYDPAAADGRQTLARGNAFIADETILQYPGESAAVSGAVDQVGGVIEGGECWIDRVLQSGVGAASLAAGPTLANLETTFPRCSWVRN